MTIAQTDEPTRQKRLRLWPGVVAAVVLCIVRFVIPVVVPGALAIGVMGGLVCALAIVAWWAFFSRAPQSERWGTLVLMIVALIATSRVVHDSIRGDDGDDAAPLRQHGPQSRPRCLGGGQPSPRPGTSTRGDGRDCPARVRRVDAPSDRWHHR